MARGLAVIVLALALAPSALGDPRTVKPDRPAINRLLDEFVPAVVEQKDLKHGWQLVGGVSRVVTYRQWLTGNTSVQTYPAKGTTFHGWLVNYSYPGDIGFDILLQSRNPKQGAWSFRAEAQKLGGRWKITSWYPVAEFAPPGQAGRVNGPADLGAGAAASAAAGREPPAALGARQPRCSRRRAARGCARARRGPLAAPPAGACVRSSSYSLRIADARATSIAATASARFPNPRVSVFLSSRSL